MSVHSRLCRIYDSLWIYWGWLWRNERSIIDIYIADNGDVQSNLNYFSRLLKKKIDKIKKGRIYKLSDAPDVYIRVKNRSFIKFIDGDANQTEQTDSVEVDVHSACVQSQDSNITYRSLDSGVLGSGWHGRVKRSSIAYKLPIDDGVVTLVKEGSPKVIKKQRARSLSFWGFFSKHIDQINKEAFWNKTLFVQPGSNAKCAEVVKTHYGIDSYFGYTLMPQLSGISLDRYLSQRKVPTADIFTILIGILGELKELSEKNIAHCDLKSSNVMIADDMSVKLFDFCTVTTYGEYPPYPPALPWFRTHTPYRSEKATETFDVYSFGVMAQTLFPRIVWSLQVDRISLEKKLEAMLSRNPGDRPSINELIVFFQALQRQFSEHQSDFKPLNVV